MPTNLIYISGDIANSFRNPSGLASVLNLSFVILISIINNFISSENNQESFTRTRDVRFHALTRPDKMADQSAVEEADHVEILEGKAKIWFSKANSVFYNPVQIFNRDLRY